MNRVDPSGLFSRSAIENSLEGLTIEEAFAKRPGLYYLLRAAQAGAKLEPKTVDFELTDNSYYPLKSSWPLNARLDCDNGKLYFGRPSINYKDSNKWWEGGPTVIAYKSARQYLDTIDVAVANLFIETYFTSWREDTVKYHYYQLSQPTENGSTFYDDFGYLTQLPDVWGRSFSVTGNIGYQRGTLTDRFGQKYSFDAGEVGIGGGIRWLEGYANDVSTRRPVAATPEQLRGAIAGEGIGGAIAMVNGYGVTIPLPPWTDPFNPSTYRGFIWYTIGLDIGASVNLSSTKFIPNEKGKPWDWVDRVSKGYLNLQDIVPMEYYSGPYDACRCNGAG